MRVGTVPRVGVLDQLRRVLRWVRERPWVAVAIVVGAILVCAWIAWAIQVGSEHGARSAIGVLIAWPALVLAGAIVALPFVGGYLLIQRLRPSDEGGAAPEPDESESGEAESETEPEAAAG
jgi:ABC-type sulfate transport system permease subunit